MRLGWFAVAPILGLVLSCIPNFDLENRIFDCEHGSSCAADTGARDGTSSDLALGDASPPPDADSSEDAAPAEDASAADASDASGAPDFGVADAQPAETGVVDTGEGPDLGTCHPSCGRLTLSCCAGNVCCDGSRCVTGSCLP